MSFPSYTDEEMKIISCLNNYQTNFTPSSPDDKCPEIHILINKDFEIVDKNTVSYRGGNLTNKMTLFAKNNYCCLIHNHPSNCSLSQSDWNTLSNFTNMTMVAVNSQGSTFRGKVIVANSYTCWLDSMNTIYDNITSEIDNFLTGLSMSYFCYEQLCFDDIKWLIGIHIGKRIKNKGIVDYEYILKGSDYFFWHKKENEVFHEKLTTLCNKYIP
ncbi:hypothetical protein FOT81_04530 [Raoultella planticola]|uniref:hypothetical protein n=1 Tax=Raoultella planticola TaxID=575 RepID=UPI00177AFDC5|nr:hypothetical protein [Raoultella planticola]MBE0090489.1 hypothetical protein [Raoultella planticola]